MLTRARSRHVHATHVQLTLRSCAALPGIRRSDVTYSKLESILEQYHLLSSAPYRRISDAQPGAHTVASSAGWGVGRIVHITYSV